MFTQYTRELTQDQMRLACPSIFATEPHESRSSRYTQIPTIEVLAGLREVGFVPTFVMQSRSRIEGKAAFTKHLVRLRREEDLWNSNPDIHELVLINSHDGTSSYQLMEGVIRMACTNGLIRGDIDNAMKVHHKGNIVDRVVEGSLTLVEEAEETMHMVEAMKQVQLSQPERLLLSEAALSIRFDLDEDANGVPTKQVTIRPSDFLNVRRREDRSTDLYTTMNVLQENSIRGVTYHDERWHKHTSRKINGIDQNVRINKALWLLATRMMEIKGQQ